MDKLKKSIEQKRGYTFDENEQEFKDGDYTFHNSNKNKITIIFDCGHKKYCGVGSLYTKAAKCIICKNKDIYQYDIITKERKCVNCNHVHKNISGANLGKFKCWNCDVNANKKVDTRLLKILNDKGLPVAKNFRYYYHDFKTANTGDLFFEKDGETIVIEIDDKSHLSKKGRTVHLKKDGMIIFSPKTRLIRLHRDDIDSFVEHLDEILDEVKDHYILVYRSSESTKKFYQDIYGDKEIRFIREIGSIEFVG